ncbi:MAG: exopolysaccharide biosynthesis polyprenyl glycosylphosphotransferase [Candidatus Latescibacterota bacterium]
MEFAFKQLNKPYIHGTEIPHMSKKSNIHFDVSERIVLLRVFDIVSVLALLYAVGLVFDFDYFKINSTHWFWSVVLALYLTIFATIFELYNLQKASRFEIVVQNVILTSSATVLFYLLTPFYTPELPGNRLQIVYLYVSINVALFIWRYAYITLISTPRFFKRVLLVGNINEVKEIVESLQKVDPNYKVMGFIDTEPNNTQAVKLFDLESCSIESVSDTIKAHRISEIVVASLHPEAMTVYLYNQLILQLKNGVPIREYTQVYEELTHRVPIQYMDRDFHRYFPFSRGNQNKLYLFFHRMLDLLFSIIGLTFGSLISPFLLIGNLFANRGPFFYTQVRVGKNGKHFRMFKLRSMVIDAEKDGAQWATKKDIRVTRFGRFLRRSRFDEIPQFINVIKGEMSVIGPRPERPVFVEKLSKKITFYEVRHLVKPGVTGWAQVNAKYGMTEDDAMDKLQYDLYYIKQSNLSLDISIVIKTLSTIIFFRGQ